MGGKALGIDHHVNRCKLKAAAVKLDITQQWVQDLIEREVSMGRVAAVHMGPPCGTASRARNIPIKNKLRKRGAPNPQPLRSSRWPEGLPGLKGVNLAKVMSANTLYSFAAKLAELCDRHGALFTIENPNSLMWETKFFRNLVAKYFFNVVDACEYGSLHKKGTAFLSNFFAPRLQKRCSGTHVHKQWGVQRTDSGEWKFDTAAEAEYPAQLAKAIAASFMDQILATGEFSVQDELGDHAAKVGAVHQPRHSRGPLLLSEFKPKFAFQFAQMLSHPLSFQKMPAHHGKASRLAQKGWTCSQQLVKMGKKVG